MIGRRLAGLFLGAAAGTAATYVMSKVTTSLYARENATAKRMEEAANDGKTSYEVAAEKTARLVANRQLTPSERVKYGNAIHWGLGITGGALYGALRATDPRPHPMKALAFGATFFLIADELANVVFGLTPPPQDYPWQTHARGLVGHLVYGITTEAAMAAPLALGAVAMPLAVGVGTKKGSVALPLFGAAKAESPLVKIPLIGAAFANKQKKASLPFFGGALAAYRS